MRLGLVAALIATVLALAYADPTATTPQISGREVEATIAAAVDATVAAIPQPATTPSGTQATRRTPMAVPTESSPATLPPRLLNAAQPTQGSETAVGTPNLKSIAHIGEQLTVLGQPELEWTFLSWEESQIAVRGPYVSGYYTFTAPKETKFVILHYRFTNAVNREQMTPYLNAGEILTDPEGYYYRVWSPPAGIHSKEYEPQPATAQEVQRLGGDSGAFETLLPGASLEGSLIFEVAANATPLEATLAGLEGLVSFGVGPAPIAAPATGPTMAPILAPSPAPTAPDLVERAEALVQRVVDGDTIDVLIDSVEYRVRYIGINTPETVHPTRGEEPYGREASARNRELVLGRTVYLDRDVSETDRYGRLLRYVWLDDATMVNAVLVAEGYAQVSTYPPDVKYADEFLELQHAARGEGLGLWGLAPASPTVGDCDPAYPDVCIPPPPPDLDCGEIIHRNFSVLAPDPHRFYGDKDGVGCERRLLLRGS